MGVKTKDMDDIMQRLRKQGLNATKLDVCGGIDDDENHPVRLLQCLDDTASLYLFDL